MKEQILRNTDLKLSSICLGTASFGEYLNQDQAFDLLDEYVRKGGNFLDTANIYCRWVPGLGNCSEQIVGTWLKVRGAYRNVVVATKGGHYWFGDRQGISRVNEKDIRRDWEESIRTLGVDVIDFYWLHRDDEEKTIEEIIDILEALRKEGKIRYYGLSNYRAERLEKAQQYLEAQGLPGPYAVSNQWSMASINPGGNIDTDPTLVEVREREYQWHVKTKTPLIPFSSTALGWFEKMRRAGVKVHGGNVLEIKRPELLSEDMKKAFWNNDNLQKYEKLLDLQKRTGYSLQALSIAYLLQQPFQVIPVCGAKSKEQLGGIMEAVEIDEII